jgi:apolipoprotein D and lipocalin family protein
VLDHADDYAWAIVGEPSGRYLWLLAREATPTQDRIEAQIDRAKALGYDTSMLIRTKQP